MGYGIHYSGVYIRVYNKQMRHTTQLQNIVFNVGIHISYEVFYKAWLNGGFDRRGRSDSYPAKHDSQPYSLPFGVVAT